MTEVERLNARRASWRKYNASAKGRARYKTYEDKNPARRERWSPAMRYRAYETRSPEGG
jgi:hypothetical protein